MKWNKYTLKTRSEVEDIVISTLADVGVEGVEIEDKLPLTESDKKQMFVDILPDGPADDGIAYLNFYVEEDQDPQPLLNRVKEALEELRMFMDIGEGTITESQTEGETTYGKIRKSACFRHFFDRKKSILEAKV